MLPQPSKNQGIQIRGQFAAKFQAPKSENSGPEKKHVHTPSHSIPPLNSLLIFGFRHAEFLLTGETKFSGVARGLLQGIPLQIPMGWGAWRGVGQLLSNSVCKILPRRFRTAFLLPRARTKSGWLEAGQELDNGWPTLDTNISVLKLQGSFLQ